MLKYLKELSIIPNIPSRKIAVVVTYNRMNFIDKWLRAWNNAEKYGVELVVIHTFDGEKPNEKETENILKHNPTFYIPIYNTVLRDYGALFMVLKNMVELPEWEHLFWFTDDMLPMRKKFLKPFVEKINKPNVGLVAQCYEPKQGNYNEHIRTIAYATKREVTNRLELPDPETHKGDCGYIFEHKGNHVLKQITEMGYKFELSHSEAESPDYQHWTSFLDWMWDCHTLSNWTEYWDVYEEQFGVVQKIDESFGSQQTIITQGEFEKKLVKKGKTTLIIPIEKCSMNDLVICVFSILQQTRNNHDIQEIIIGLNGENKTLDEEREQFIKSLANIQIGESKKKISYESFNSMTKGKMIDQMAALVKTEIYVVIQEKTFFTSDLINEEIISFNSDSFSGIHIEKTNKDRVFSINENRIKLPSIGRAPVMCKKHMMTQFKTSWEEYSIDEEYYIGNFQSHKKFMDKQKKIGRMENDMEIKEDHKFSGIDAPVGSFVVDKISKTSLIETNFESTFWEDINLWDDVKRNKAINELFSISEIGDILYRFYYIEDEKVIRKSNIQEQVKL